MSGAMVFLFTDLERSTQRWEDDPDGMAAALMRHDAVVRTAIDEHGGTWFKHTGDGACATFDDPVNAAAAALAIQGALREDEMLSTRIGIHLGEAAAREGDWFGSTLNRCARLMSAAHGGQTIVSGEVAAALHGRLAMLDLGEHRLKDLRDPLRVFQLGPDTFPPLRSLSTTPTNLPIQHSAFLGRARELATVGGALERGPLVTLTGVGGSGKTRLALQAAADVAAQFPDGVYFVDLAAEREPERVPRAVATAIGTMDTFVEADATSAAEAAAAVRSWLASWVASRKVLLVLDNCEHVIDEAARITDTVLSAGEQVRVIATSRESLAIAGEFVVPVGALDEAVQLFLERCRALKPDLALTPEVAAHASALCDRLDGIPLAIELAASRITVLTVPQIDERLADAFRLLRTTSRGTHERHQTLEAALHWSYDLLDADERTMFRRLGVFESGCSLDAVEAVCASPPLVADVIDVLQRLIEKSLLVFDDASGRYRMLEVIAQFARRLLEASEERVSIQDRHLELAVALAAPASSALSVNWAYRPVLEPDHPNLMRAFSYAVSSSNAQAALRLATATPAHWRSLGLGAIGRDWLDRALLIDDGRDPMLTAVAFASLIALRSLGGDYRTTVEDYDEAIHMFERVPGGQLGVAYCLFGSARALDIVGRPEEAGPRYDCAIDLFGRLGDRSGQAWTMFNRAWVCFVRGDRQLAAEMCEAIRQGSPADVGVEPYMAAELIAGLNQMIEGDVEIGRSVYRNALERTSFNLVEHSYFSWMAATVELDLGAEALATELLRTSLEQGRTAGALELLEGQLETAGVLAASAGQPRRAAAIMSAAAAAAQRTGIKTGVRRPWALADDAQRIITASLSPQELAAARDDGSRWTLSEAVDAALLILDATSPPG